ncbi:MAG: DNA-binding response regulator, partial [Alphaproteobacteria bacterium]|nr:DNA-binding response regulator [Alphaproteobacteria bacterium]
KPIARDRADLLECFNLLTPREREIMAFVVRGHANKETAARLGISQRTVENHRKQVMIKMGAESLADLVRMATSIESASSQDSATPPSLPAIRARK